MSRWYVTNMDNDLIATGNTYREAREACLNVCDDGRKHPDIKRIRPGMYEYLQSSCYPSVFRKRYYIGTKQSLGKDGFDVDALDQEEGKNNATCQ